jgi:hypothetical protein
MVEILLFWVATQADCYNLKFGILDFDREFFDFGVTCN